MGAEVTEARQGVTGRRVGTEMAPVGGLVASVRRYLVRAILERHFDTRLPSIDDLVLRLGVSRTTVRAALQELERDGLVSRRRAVGTLINRHVGPGVLFFNRLLEIDDLLRTAGHEPQRTSGWGVPVADHIVHELAGVPAEAVVGAFRRYAVGDHVVAAETDFFRRRDALLCGCIEDPPSTLSGLVAERLASKIDNSVIRLRPEVSGAGDACSLPIGDGRPYLRVMEQHFDKAGKAVAWSVIDIDVDALPIETFRRNG